jgi:hypothetical protein
MPLLNAEMLERPQRRAAFRKLWRIDEPFHATPIHAVESSGGGGGGFPPFPHAKSPGAANRWPPPSAKPYSARCAIPRGEGALHIGTRSGGYVRAFLKDATTEASAIFSEALHETLGPLDNPRYVIPRYVDFLEDTWLSRILPRLVGQYFQRSQRTMQMLHAVPPAFAKYKDLALIYQRHWNAHVSPGEAMFALRGDGEVLLEQARQSGATPSDSLHRKEVFLWADFASCRSITVSNPRHGPVSNCSHGG